MNCQIAAGEARNPRRNLPKAIRRVYIRILLFYIGGVTIIGLLVPSNDPGLKLGSGTAAASPFVIAIRRSGIKVLPGVFLSQRPTGISTQSLLITQLINACLLTSAWSAASSDLYTSSRALCEFLPRRHNISARHCLTWYDDAQTVSRLPEMHLPYSRRLFKIGYL